MSTNELNLDDLSLEEREWIAKIDPKKLQASARENIEAALRVRNSAFGSTILSSEEFINASAAFFSGMKVFSDGKLDVDLSWSLFTFGACLALSLIDQELTPLPASEDDLAISATSDDYRNIVN